MRAVTVFLGFWSQKLSGDLPEESNRETGDSTTRPQAIRQCLPVEAMGLTDPCLKGDIYKRCFFGSPDDGFGCLELWNMFKGVEFFFKCVCSCAVIVGNPRQSWWTVGVQSLSTHFKLQNQATIYVSRSPPIHWFSYGVGWNLKLSNLGYRLSSSWASSWGSTSIFIVSLSFLLLLPLRNRLGHRGGGPSEMVAKRCRDTDVLKRWGHHSSKNGFTYGHGLMMFNDV